MLEIQVDEMLTWDKQIDSVCLNITGKITLMKMLSKYVNQDSLKLYFNSYILHLFDYGCVVWGHCSANNMDRLLKLQKERLGLSSKKSLIHHPIKCLTFLIGFRFKKGSIPSMYFV